MTNEITYDVLWEVCQKEKQTNQLLTIPRNFYGEALEFVNKTAADKTDPQAQTASANSLRLLNEIFEKRKQKILVYLAYNRALPQPISNLELEFYNRVAQAAKSEKLSIAETKSRGRLSLKSLIDIPEIVLPSGNKAGPFKKDQIIEFDNANADTEFLISNSICEAI